MTATRWGTTCRQAAALLREEAARRPSPFAEPMHALFDMTATVFDAGGPHLPPAGMRRLVLDLAETVVLLAPSRPAEEATPDV